MSSSPFNNHLVTVPKGLITIGIIVTFMFLIFFYFLARSRYLPFFHFTSVLFCGQTGQQSRQFCKLFFFCGLLFVLINWTRLGDQFVLLKSHRILCVILSDRCWVVNITFVPMVKFQFLAQLPVDHIAHLVVSSLILLLC